MNNPAFTAFTALALKAVGVVMIVSSLVDYIILAIPPQGLGADGLPGWLVNLTGQISDRGIIPMIGIVLIVGGFWIADSAGAGGGDRVSAFDLRFLSFVLAGLLGLMFLLAIPLHLVNLQRTRNEAIQQIDQSVNVAETQIESQSEQLNQLLQDETRISELDRAIASGQFAGPQLEQLQNIRQQIDQLRADPALLDNQIEEARTQLRERRQQAESRARGTAIKTAIRTT
ncbi:MAG: hypothetical protein HC838_15430, partial [Spirulinaceae cyanobacterium RM2_2_10]|nr:hypothetical protein [Spirulinaceae cyanobacterium RM2_2_10]